MFQPINPYVHMQDNNVAQPDIAGLIQSCLLTLTSLRQSIIKQQWRHIPENIKQYETETALFQRVWQEQECQPEEFLNALKHLQTQQRQTMRILFEAQQYTQEHINTTNLGLRKVQRLSSMVN